jgi:hypothetical protein
MRGMGSVAPTYRISRPIANKKRAAFTALKALRGKFSPAQVGGRRERSAGNNLPPRFSHTMAAKSGAEELLECGQKTDHDVIAYIVIIYSLYARLGKALHM